ncbi:DUF5615 family PIN-like protein [Thioalkalivibrio sp. ALMg11]|uniref:DUF5615 family PIN-like protein n=1 Tax=Thioalkalivibrio sp. ALMg11 TaxID=1158165 RepID=UPI00036A8FD8|nr:DUF5615 family PIN-like protein [Thioalkalivibrio sp. ALMg11]
MRFLVDAQLPPALARWRVDRGVEADHVADVGLLSASDKAIWAEATRTGAVILTKDEDFAVWRSAGSSDQPAVVWLRVGNTRKAALLQWFEPLLPRVLEALERGDLLIEVD